MKRLLSTGILAAGLMFVAPAIHAQDCRTRGVSALQGTYAFTATAWQDLSEVNPMLPKGYAPVTIIGTFTINGKGDLAGSAWVNAGGLAMTATFVNSRVAAPSSDCTFTMSMSMKINEFEEAVTGPYPYVGVIAADGPPQEIAFMMLGAGPGSHVELDRAKRISMKFD